MNRSCLFSIANTKQQFSILSAVLRKFNKNRERRVAGLEKNVMHQHKMSRNVRNMDFELSLVSD